LIAAPTYKSNVYFEQGWAGQVQKVDNANAPRYPGSDRAFHVSKVPFLRQASPYIFALYPLSKMPWTFLHMDFLHMGFLHMGFLHMGFLHMD
jgi:hypothetical protein